MAAQDHKHPSEPEPPAEPEHPSEPEHPAGQEPPAEQEQARPAKPTGRPTRRPTSTLEIIPPGKHTTGTSIRTKLIAASMVLLVIVIGLFALVNSIQSKRIIDGTAARLEVSITESLRRAGRAQLTLLAGTSRISLVQSDYTTLQTIVQDISKQDERVIEAAVVDRSGKILAHAKAALVGQEARGSLRAALTATELRIQTGETTAGHRSMVFAAPVHVSGAPSSAVFLAYSLKPLEAELAKANALRDTEVRASLLNTLLVGLLAIAIGVVLTVLQGLRITRPIQALVHVADRISSGELQARVDVREKDEIGLLGERFNYMAEQVLVLMEQTKETASMERELEVAAAIQTKLVPEVAEVELPGLEIAGYFQPAERCGGDWWHYYRLDDGRILMLVGDVTGHGIPSAMITAVVKGAASNMVAVNKAGQLDLNKLLKALDVAVHEAARGELCMTCFASIYDPVSHAVTFANAGHPFPLIYKGDGKFASMVVRGDRLGDLAGRDYETRTQKVDVGDLILWYTDGIIEGADAAGNEFREKRLRAAVRRNAEHGPEGLRDAVIDGFHRFLDGVPYEDDVTLVVAQVIEA